MTARPTPVHKSSENLRVLRGRRVRRPSLAPWMIMVIIGVIAFLGIGFARTSLDKSAFELDEITRAIEEQSAINRQLNLEIASLENPARIAPLAEELGMVIPVSTNQILVQSETESQMLASNDPDGSNQ